MALIEKGRVCIVTKGRDAGNEVVVKEVIDKNFVTIAGEKVKERRSNVRHLEATARKVTKIPAGKVPKVKKPKTEKKEDPKKAKKIKKEKPKDAPVEESKADKAAREILEEAKK